MSGNGDRPFRSSRTAQKRLPRVVGKGLPPLPSRLASFAQLTFSLRLTDYLIIIPVFIGLSTLFFRLLDICAKKGEQMQQGLPQPRMMPEQELLHLGFCQPVSP